MNIKTQNDQWSFLYFFPPFLSELMRTITSESSCHHYSLYDSFHSAQIYSFDQTVNQPTEIPGWKKGFLKKTFHSICNVFLN